MTNIFLGGLFGAGVGYIVCLFLYSVTMPLHATYTDAVWTGITVAFLACLAFGFWLGNGARKASFTAYKRNFQVSKAIIEGNLAKADLSREERAELVEEAKEENFKLMEYKYKAGRLFGFLIPQDVVALEPIRTEGR